MYNLLLGMQQSMEEATQIKEAAES
jgi:hypothetical protein